MVAIRLMIIGDSWPLQYRLKVGINYFCGYDQAIIIGDLWPDAYHVGSG
jgi:hypothetical protein